MAARIGLVLGDVHFEVLPNGLTLLLRESRRAPVAAVQIWARVGSADERPGEEGLAHFHEHMLFKGTERRGLGEVAGEIEGVGGRINAYTSFDVTVYHATVPADATTAALDVLVDAVRRSVFDPDEIRREIDVVLEEIRRSEDSPHQVCGNALFAELYRAHPYRAPILGTRESVVSFDRDRVRAFFRRWYTPEHLMVVAVGDFDAQALGRAAAAAFADATPGEARRARPAEPAERVLRALLLRRNFERACVELGWPAVGLADADTAALDLLGFVLGEGESSRLVRRVKERAGLVDRIDAFAYTPLDPGVFGVAVDLDPERTEDALAAILQETERVRRHGVSAEELEKARTNFLAQEDFDRESVGGLARKLGSFQALAGDFRREAEYLDAVRRATPEDLRRVAQDYLAPERLSMAAVVPEGSVAELDPEALVAAVRRGADARSVQASFLAPAARAPELRHYALPNGAELFVEARREVPVVAARGAFLGGLLAEDQKNAGLTSFLTSMWLRGTRHRSAAELARAIESLAADLDGFSGRNSMGATLEVPSARLEPALDLFAEVLLEPAFDAEELERERRDTLAAIARREDRLAARAFDLFCATHWERHPYRLPLVGSAESVARVSRADLEAHHARLVRSRNLALAVVGDVDPDDLAEALAGRLVDLDGGGFEAPAPPLEAPPREPREAELVKERAQAHLVIGFRGVTVHDEDRYALEVIAQLLAGQGGRLFLELRDRRSLAYSVSAMNVEGLAPGFFAVYIASAPEKLGEARRGLFEELERLVQEAPSDAALERARRYLVGNFAIDRQRNAARAAQTALDVRYGLGADAAVLYPERIRAVGREDVLRVARQVVDLSAYTLAVIRSPGS